MSGIVGMLNLDGAPIDRALLKRMTRFLAARGPDAQDMWVDGSVGFGHTLLRSTFEQEKEKQPLSFDDQVWITADARVDGRPELIGLLRSCGRRLEENAPDVELILHAYHLWHADCVQHLIGDFVFGIWDARTRTLFCARDQFGIVPFYYAQFGNTLVFSNTLDCLRLHPVSSDRLNEQAIGDFLLFGSNENPATTTFSDIHRLPPGHTLTFTDGALLLRRYWSVPERVDIQGRPSEQIIVEFHDLFERAVKDRLRTDRIAVQMSGGTDSTSVAVTARRLLQNEPEHFELRAYTISVDHLMVDEERHYASLVASEADIPIRHIAWKVPDTLELDDAAFTTPEPGYLPSLGASVEIWHDTTAFSRVTLSGLGGDPLLYPSSTFLLDSLLGGQWPRVGRALREQLRLQGKLPPLYLRSRLKRKARGARALPMPGWINAAFPARLDLGTRWKEINAARESEDLRLSMANSPRWSNAFSQGDPAASFLPIEIRYPFFDMRLFEFVLKVPPVPWFVHKTLLREAMRGELPEEVRRRPKTPLAADPLYILARQGRTTWMKELAAAPELEPYVNRDGLGRLIEAADPVTTQEFSLVYRSLALAYWFRTQNARRAQLLEKAEERRP